MFFRGRYLLNILKSLKCVYLSFNSCMSVHLSVAIIPGSWPSLHCLCIPSCNPSWTLNVCKNVPISSEARWKLSSLLKNLLFSCDCTLGICCLVYLWGLINPASKGLTLFLCRLGKEPIIALVADENLRAQHLRGR